ncbi:MAG: hypothetical protein ACTSSQ_01490 [Alphaproteobacteria bacterium]
MTNTIIRSIALATLSLSLTSAALAGNKFQGGGNGPATIKYVKLAASGKNKGCPDKMALISRAETTGPINVKFRYRQAGGGKSALITVKAKKTQNGKWVAKHVQEFTIAKTTNTKYMVEAQVGKKMKVSKWAPVKKSCMVALVPGIINLPNKVLSANLAIKGPITNVCPTSAKLSAAVVQTTNKPVQIMIARIGQGVGAPIMLQPKKAANGKWVAVYKKTIPVNQAINARYKVLVGGGQGVTSNNAPLKASCKIAGGPGGLLLGG